MSLLSVEILGRELGMVPPLVLGGLVVARRVAERVLTWHREKGERSGFFSTSLLFLSYVSAFAFALWSLGRRTSPVHAVTAGGSLWAAAIALRMWALVHLKEQFSFWIEIREGHRLVDTGPYAIIRHPLHLAFALEVTAFSLGAWTVWAVVPTALAWIVVAARNRTEEAALREHFGEAWEEYAAHVPSMNLVRGLTRLARGTQR